MNKYALAIHGGAGVIPQGIKSEIKESYLQGLKEALDAGHAVLEKNGSALDAVEASVISLENNSYFNAGKGSVFTADESHEMDASIMDGSSLKCGAVAGVNRVKNPISLAKSVLSDSAHILLIGAGAEQFAEQQGIEFADKDYFYSEFRYQQLQNAKNSGITALDHSVFDKENEIKKKGTVGAVALDMNGNLAAATSTGGMTNKHIGRVGDSSIIGAGTYADNRTVAVSCTGDGEEFIRHVVAYDVHAQIFFANKSMNDAVEFTLKKQLKPDDGGLIAIDKNGLINCAFNTAGMFRASVGSDQEEEVKIWE